MKAGGKELVLVNRGLAIVWSSVFILFIAGGSLAQEEKSGSEVFEPGEAAVTAKQERAGLATTGAGLVGKLSFWTNLRLRYEYQDGFNIKFYGDNPKQGKSNDGFLLGRFRFGLHYDPNEMIRLALGVQHSEAWDLAFKESDFYNSKFDRIHNQYEDNWEPFDTYLEIRKVLPFSIKGGRQVITYGNNRIFGPGQWGNSGRWLWDAAKVDYRFKGGFVDAYYGKTVVHDPSHLSWKHNHGFESLGFYGHFELPKHLSGIAFEPFSMTKKNNRDRYTGEDGQVGDFDAYYLGGRIYKKYYNGFDFDFTFISQDGDQANDDIDAYGYHLLMAYDFKETGFKPRISTEYSYASGDSDPADGTLETFDGAFGARDKMFGRMNLFYWKNLKDAQINLEVRPKNWLYFKAEYHQFWLAQSKDAWYLNSKEYLDKTGNSGDKVGRELDIVGKLNLPKGHEIQFGYGHFWPDEFAREQASDKEANWVFLQWMYRFSYPSSKCQYFAIGTTSHNQWRVYYEKKACHFCSGFFGFGSTSFCSPGRRA